jgi:hypothetical protein
VVELASAEAVERPDQGARNDGEGRTRRGGRSEVDDRREPLPREGLERLTAPVGDETVSAPAQEVDDHQVPVAEDLDDLGEEELIGGAAGRRGREGEVEARSRRCGPAVRLHPERERIDPGDVPRRDDESVEAGLREGGGRDGNGGGEGALRNGEAVAVRRLPGAATRSDDRRPAVVAGEGNRRKRLFRPVRLPYLDPEDVGGPGRKPEMERAVGESVGLGVRLRRVVEGGHVAAGADGSRSADELDHLRVARRDADGDEPRLAVGRRQVFRREGRDEIGRLSRDAVDEAAPREVAQARPERQDERRVPRESRRWLDDEGARSGRRLDPRCHGDRGPDGWNGREDDALRRDGERVERLGELDGKARMDEDDRARSGRDGHPRRRRRCAARRRESRHPALVEGR